MSLCQRSIQTADDSTKILCSKWQLVESKINDEDPPFLPDGSQFIIYQKDGSYLMTVMGVAMEGKWKLDSRNNLLITKDEEANLTWKILKLTSTELKLETKRDGGKVFMLLKRKQ